MNEDSKSRFPISTRGVCDHLAAGLISSLIAALAGYLWTRNSQTVLAIAIIAVSQIAIIAGVVLVVIRRIEKRGKWVSMKDFSRRTEEHHQFVHAARDLVVKVMGKDPVGKRGSRSIVPAEFHPDLHMLVQRLAALFRMLSPQGTGIFASIRERRGQHYVTIIRAGDCDNKVREKGTKPLHRENKMVSELVRSFKASDCVLLTGSGEANWHSLPNDILGQDQSVLMGAVFSKKWDNLRKEFKPLRLEWIICVAANRPKVFNEDHKPLMKCFNDVFAVLLNHFVRYAVTDSGQDLGGKENDDDCDSP